MDQLCWHPTKRDVFATASADKTMRIWDARGTRRSREGVGVSCLAEWRCRDYGGVLISEGVVLCTGFDQWSRVERCPLFFSKSHHIAHVRVCTKCIAK